MDHSIVANTSMNDPPNSWQLRVRRSRSRETRQNPNMPAEFAVERSSRRSASSSSVELDDAGADQQLVAHDSEGEAGQDRHEGGAPWSLCRVSDGRGRHSGLIGLPKPIDRHTETTQACQRMTISADSYRNGRSSGECGQGTSKNCQHMQRATATS